MMCDWVVLLIVRAARNLCFTAQTSFRWEIKPVVASRNVGCFLRLFKKDTSLQNTRRVGSRLRASSPIWASETSLARTRERAAKPRGAGQALLSSTPRSRVLARLASLAQIGELARKLSWFLFTTAEIFPFAFHSFLFYSLLRGRSLVLVQAMSVRLTQKHNSLLIQVYDFTLVESTAMCMISIHPSKVA